MSDLHFHLSRLNTPQTQPSRTLGLSISGDQSTKPASRKWRERASASQRSRRKWGCLIRLLLPHRVPFSSFAGSVAPAENQQQK